MSKFLNSIVSSERIVDLMVFAAIAIFLIQVLSMIPNLINVFPSRPGTAVLGAIMTTLSALIQPCLLLGVARVITLMQNRAKNA
jgi:hypothetical protein